MKKRAWITLLAAAFAICFAFALTGCGEKEPPVHTHSWSSTYTEDGDRHYQTCDGCNEKKYSDHSFNANGECVCGKHKEIEHTHKWSSTYKEDGDRHYQTCDGCDEKKYGDHEYKNGKCVCGKEEPTGEHKHSWSTTYIEDGEQHYQTCDGCDEKKYGDHNYDKNGDCICGKHKEEGHQHVYTEQVVEAKYLKSKATCKDRALYYYSCVCGEAGTDTFEDGDFAPHTEVPDKAVPATCTEEGLTEGSHCSVCGEILQEQMPIEPLGHTEVIEEGRPATCTEEGLTDRIYCSVCGEVIQEQMPIEPLEHDIISVSGQAATCTKVGWEAYEKCLRCDYTTYREIPKTPHTEIFDEGYPATCTESGLTEGMHCAFCNKVLVKQETIEALGHTEVIDAAKEPTCTESGFTEGKHCSVCNLILVEQNFLPAAHKEVIDEAVAPDCTHTGLTEGKHCSVCGKVFVKQEVLPTSHSYENKVCTICGKLKPSDGLKIEQSYDGYSVTGIGTCTDSEILIPDEYYGKPVTSIGLYAFNGVTTFTSITIPDTVTRIVGFPFDGCSSLARIYYTGNIKSWCELEGLNGFMPSDHACKLFIGGAELAGDFTIPDDVTTISDYAFRYCRSLTGVIIPDHVTSIGSRAFAGCSALKTVTVGEGVQRIGNSAFEDCTSLTDMTVGSGVKTIESNAFHNCTSLKSIALPAGLQSIEYSVFENCSSLATVMIPDGVTSIKSDAFRDCIALSSIIIPNGVTSIGAGAFLNCPIETVSVSISLISEIPTEKVKTLDITGGENIGENAFKDHAALTSLTIGESITNIGQSAFEGCSLLESLTLGKGVTSIGSCAFARCGSLPNVEISKNVTEIGAQAFAECSTLSRIAVDGNNANYKSIDGNLYNKDGTTLIQYAIGKTAAGFFIPYGVTKIGDYACWKCTTITNVEVSRDVTSIGDSAFEGCSAVTRTVIGIGVKEIGNNAFKDCPIEDVGIPTWAISSIPKMHMKVVVILTSGESIEESAFEGCGKLSSVSIGKGVTSIGNNAFKGCGTLTNVGLPEGIQSIGQNVFEGCSALTIKCDGEEQPSTWNADWNCNCPVVWNSNLNKVASDGFIYAIVNGIRYALKDGTATIARQPSNITEADIPVNVIYENANYPVIGIVDNAFENCPIETASVPAFACSAVKNEKLKTLTIMGGGNFGENIGDGAFDGCSSLTSVTVCDGITNIGQRAFYGCSSLTNISLPEGLLRIDSHAFEDCRSLTSIALPNGLTNIGEESTFEGCSSLTSIVIPNGVKTIPWYAFRDCSSLEQVTIGSGVTSIGEDAFGGCSSLTSFSVDQTNLKFKSVDGNLYSTSETLVRYAVGKTALNFAVPDTVQSIEKRAFSDCVALQQVTIPGSVKSIEDGAFANCTSLTSINLPDSVTSIAKNTFANCTSLVNVTIGNGVTSIGEYAFLWCTSLTSIYYHGTAAEFETLTVGSGNDNLTSATKYFYSQTNPFEGESAVTEGNYWHYGAENKIEIWTKE